MRARSAALVGLVVAALTLGLVAPAATADDRSRKRAVDQQIAGLRGELEGISSAMAAAAAALDRAEAQLAAAQQLVAVLRGQLAAAQAREAQLVEALKVAQAQVDRAQRQIDETQAREAAAKTQLGRMASASYQSSDTNGLAVVLDAQSPADVADRVVLAHSAMQSQSAVIADLANARADLAAQRATLDAKRAQVQSTKEAQEATVARISALTSAAVSAEQDVAALTATRAQALAAIRAQRALEQQRLANAQAQSRALAQRIAAAAAAAARRARLSRAPVSRSGGLLWPGPGSLREGVGPRTNPYTGGLSCHAGIDIGAAEGDPVHAAASGVVVMTTFNAWDGNVVIIAHAGGMTTWYAHLSAFQVSAGQRVARGDLIGLAGSTGFATGPHLHFNVAVNGVAYDPMGWFGGPMRQVASLCQAPYPQPTL